MTAPRPRLAVSNIQGAGERGISLVELIVAMMLLGIVSAIVVGMYVGTARATSQGQSVDGDTRTASNGINEVARMIRAATENPVLNPAPGTPATDPAIEAGADSSSITLYAYVNLETAEQKPVKVRFFVDPDGQLVEQKWTAAPAVNGHWSFPTAQADRILAGPLLPGTPVFIYLQGDGSEIVVPVGGLTNPDTLRTIKAVTVTMTIQSNALQSLPVTLQNTVGMPNLGLTRARTDAG
jgi:prepilin-type N-terminal cleavage/methylation domain-containing protein